MTTPILEIAKMTAQEIGARIEKFEEKIEKKVIETGKELIQKAEGLGQKVLAEGKKARDMFTEGTVVGLYPNLVKEALLEKVGSGVLSDVGGFIDGLKSRMEKKITGPLGRVKDQEPGTPILIETKPDAEIKAELEKAKATQAPKNNPSATPYKPKGKQDLLKGAKAEADKIGSTVRKLFQQGTGSLTPVKHK